MSLTPQNMESREGLFSHTIYRDIARMDEAQLDKYVRMAFTGQRDTGFLPEPFWDYWFEFGKHGESRDGREKPSPASFLSGTHNLIAGTEAGVFTVGHDTDEKPAFSFRETYRNVLQGVLKECVDIVGEPTSDQKALASYAVEAVGAIQTPEGFGRYYEEMVAQRSGGKETAPISHNFSPELGADLAMLSVQHGGMLEASQQLIDGGRFGTLQLHYSPYQ